MGSFSWMRADRLTKVGNIYEGGPFKCLIPKEFGGGFIKDHYQDYGQLGRKDSGGPKYDMYELLAFWNGKYMKDYTGERISSKLQWKGKELGEPMPLMKEMDEFTNKNRGYGIDIGCYDNQIKRLKYPLKLVSIRNKNTYEENEEFSVGDPEQGWGKHMWEKYDKTMEEHRLRQEERFKKEVEERVELQKMIWIDTAKKHGVEIKEDDQDFIEMVEKYRKEKEEGLRDLYFR